MAKSKLKLDKQALQAALMRHVEKIVMAIVVVVFLLLSWSAVALPTYSKTAEQLNRAANDAQSRIRDSKVGPGVKASPYPELAARGKNQIEEKFYANNALWNPSLFPRRLPRTEPNLFTVEGLRAKPDFGAFSSRGGAAGSSGSLVGQRWVVLTGLVPVAKQLAAYQEAFRDHRRPETDTPDYLGYMVERAEINADTDMSKLQWQAIDALKAMKLVQTWESGTKEEVVAPQFLQEKATDLAIPLAYPLGPLSGKNWDESVAHVPEIPLAASLERGAGETEAPPATENPLPTGPFGNINRPQAAAPAAGGAEAAVAGGVAAAAAPRTVVASGNKVDRENVPYLLFRFFDFDVQPGKTYCYRVRLGLKNPNKGFETRYLQNAELAKKDYLLTAYTEPSATITVPADDRVLLQQVSTATHAKDISATLAAKKWVHEKGQIVTAWISTTRGQLISENDLKMSRNLTAMPKAGKGPKRPTADETAAAEKYPFKPDCIVVDIRGGDLVTPNNAAKEKQPAQVLLLYSDGRLEIHDEVDDATEVKQLGAPPAVASELGGESGPPVMGAGVATEGGAGTSILDSDTGKAGKKKPPKK